MVVLLSESGKSLTTCAFI